MNAVRHFESGANRDTEAGKIDFAGALAPEVLAAFGRYMHSHRELPDGTVRSAGNWKHGFPRDVILRSLLRHVMDLWLIEETGKSVRPETGEPVDIDDALGGVLFNVQALWLETLRSRQLEPTAP